MEKRLITGPNELYSPATPDSINWRESPEFRFLTEVDALQTLEMLGEDLRSAREQARQVMRYIEAAVIGARTESGTVQDGPVSAQAIIGATGLARQTVYKILHRNDLLDPDEDVLGTE
ncbi:hypothetical protein ABZ470_39535 [Streptosporangium sp. NPDC020072]|uniref:hypothetical protein n=1 Tax=Streptosporangium sp. NPDC020072 TaxID=3154788 RepID=UPI00343BF04F